MTEIKSKSYTHSKSKLTHTFLTELILIFKPRTSYTFLKCPFKVKIMFFYLFLNANFSLVFSIETT